MKSKPINFVKKTWGFETWIHNDKDYCGKTLTVYLDKKCSLHYHKLKKETFYVLEGRVQIITIDTRDVLRDEVLEAGDMIEVDRLVAHQFKGLAFRSVIMEVSTQHFDSDSYRILQ